MIRYHSGVFTTYTEADGLPDSRIRLPASGKRHPGRRDAARDGAVGRRPLRAAYRRQAPGDDPRRSWSATTGSAAVWYRDAEGIHRLDKGRVTRRCPVSIRGACSRIAPGGSGWRPRTAACRASRRRGCRESTDRRTACSRPRPSRCPKTAKATLVRVARRRRPAPVRWRAVHALFDGGRPAERQRRAGVPGSRRHPVGSHRGRPGAADAAVHDLLLVRRRSRGRQHLSDFPGQPRRCPDRRLAGLTRYRDGTFTPVAREFGVAGDNVMSLAEDREGAVWIGLWGGGGAPGEGRDRHGLSRQRRLTRRRGPRDPPGASPISGSAAARPVAVSRRRVHARCPGYAGGEVHALFEDRAGTLWIGTDSGLLRYRDGIFTDYGAKPGWPAVPSAPSTRIATARCGSARMTAACSGSATAVSPATPRAKDCSPTARSGSSKTPGALLDQLEQRHLPRRAARARRVRERHASRRSRRSPYGRRDGMLNPECNGGAQPAGIRARDGRIWFPTQRGVAVFDPETIAVDTTPPPVLITALLVADQPVPLSDRDRDPVRPARDRGAIRRADLHPPRADTIPLPD